MAVPRIVLAVGGRPAAISGTPRSRVGAVLAAATPRSPRIPADVLLRLPATGPADAVIDELAASLPSLVAAAAAAETPS